MVHVGYASHTPVTDGERVYCFFANHGVVAFDMDGNRVWETEPFSEFVPTPYGSAGSPILFEDLLLVNASMEVKALIAYEKSSGTEKWRIENFQQCYGVPVLIKPGSNPLMVIHAGGHAWAFHPRNGEVVWKYENGRGGYVVPAVMTDGKGSVILSTPNGGKPDLSAISTEGGSPLWGDDARVSATGTGMLKNGLIYNFDWLMTCHRADNGEKLWEEQVPSADGRSRIGGGSHGSMFCAGDLVYLTNTQGQTAIFKAGPEFEVVSTNQIKDAPKTFVYASMVGSEGKLYLRTQEFLYCISDEYPRRSSTDFITGREARPIHLESNPPETRR